MFREGYYLEVIKASDNCSATAVVTIKEKTVEYKKKKMTTNKWLDLRDWASLYAIIRKAVVRNRESESQGDWDSSERKKSTGRLEVKYKFERTAPSDGSDPLPTIRVSVAPVRKSLKPSGDRNGGGERRKDKKIEKAIVESGDKSTTLRSAEDGFLLENCRLEEYVPPGVTNGTDAGFEYVPSRKSTLRKTRSSKEVDEYTPTAGTRETSFPVKNDDRTQVSYVPNSIESLANRVHEVYDPCGVLEISADLSEAYVPGSKGSEIKVEEYQPDFSSKTMKFDDSYVPSSTCARLGKDKAKKRIRRSRESRKNKSTSTSSSTSSSHSNRSLLSKIAEREL